MSDPFAIVKDSSIWQSSHAFSASNKKDAYLRIAIVKKVYRDERTTELRYLVELQDRNDSVEVNARVLQQFGGVYNYQESVNHGYKFDDNPDPVRNFEAKAGDTVLVAFLNGEGREAIIMGGLTHPARTSVIDITKGPQFASEFNGIETIINELGEYTVTFKAIPTNIKMLDNKPANKLPVAQYDTKIGSSFLKFDKTGSFEVSDKATDGIQNMRIDKAAGTVTTNAGKVSLKFTKASEQVDLKAKVTNVISDTSISGKTQMYSMDASTSVKIKSPKVAIGKDGVELLDQLSQLIDAIGKLIAISPVGPCNALVTSPEWDGVASVQAKIKEITGSL